MLIAYMYINKNDTGANIVVNTLINKFGNNLLNTFCSKVLTHAAASKKKMTVMK